MILAVTGWRGYTDGAFIRKSLHRLNGWCGQNRQTLHVRVGDALVLAWCIENGISHHVFYAEWEQRGVRGGPERNRRMLLGSGDRVQGVTDLLMAFPRPDGLPIRVPGSGTWGCCIEAFRQGIRVDIPAYQRSGD